MPATKIKLISLKLNDGTHGLPKNPRFIRDEKFAKLVDSIKDFPEAMPARGIVVDENSVILGGNMRWRACKELGLKEIPAEWVHRMKGLTAEQKRRFIIMDNRAFGEDDFDVLANGFDMTELLDGGFMEDELAGFDEAIKKHETELKDVDVRLPPQMAWVLIGVPIGSWGKVAGIAEATALIPGSIVETTANDSTDKD